MFLRDKARVWEPFRRLDRAVEAGISGNGIGLAVVRELVAAQRGTVTVHDAPGGGASFVVTLQPAADASRTPPSVRPNEPTSFPAATQREPSLQ